MSSQKRTQRLSKYVSKYLSEYLSRHVPRLSVAALLLGAGPASAATLTVGQGKQFAKPCAAIAAAQAGDTIEVDAGSYPGDTCAWTTDNLTVRGVGGRAVIDLTGVTPSQQKGIFTIYANNATVENFELSHAAISQNAGNNGAGIRHQGLNLTVRNCYFHDNQDGILGGPSTAQMGTVLIEHSEFSHNGAGDGFSHNMYIGNYAQFTLQYSYSHMGNVGHLVKSRALTNIIQYNRITDEKSGTASYEIDLPNGGTAYVIGNIVEQSALTQNPNILDFGEEGVPQGYDNHLFVVNNTFLNDKGSGTFVNPQNAAAAQLVNNIFYGGGTVTSQNNAVQTTNFIAPMNGDPKFANLAAFDVHLLAGSPCIDKGSDPGKNGNQSLAPSAQYLDPLQGEARAVVGGAIDIGAYEYGNVAVTDMGGVADMVNVPDSATMPGDLGSSSPDMFIGGGSDLSTLGATDLAGVSIGTTNQGCSCAVGGKGGGRAAGGGWGDLAVGLVALALTGLRRARSRASAR